MCYKTITNSIRLMAQDMPDCLLRCPLRLKSVTTNIL